MSDFDLNFAEAMSKASELILYNDSPVGNNAQAAVHIAQISCEISLKYLIKKAGLKVLYIHDLKKLMEQVAECTVEIDAYEGKPRRVPAELIFVKSVKCRDGQAILRKLLEAEKYGASNYPGNRYSRGTRNYPAPLWQQTSEVLLKSAREYAPSIQGPEKDQN